MMSLFCVQYESTTPPTGYRRILYCCFREKSNIAMATEKGNKTCRYGIFTAFFPKKVSILANFIGSVAFCINFSCQIYTVVSNYWYLSWFWHQHQSHTVQGFIFVFYILINASLIFFYKILNLWLATDLCSELVKQNFPIMTMEMIFSYSSKVLNLFYLYRAERSSLRSQWRGC